MVKLRDYQREAVNSVYTYFKTKSGNPLIAMPPGTGKSVVIAKLAEELCTTFCNYRITIVTHVKELIQQNYTHFISFWPTAPAGIYSSGMKRKDTHARITFAGIQSIYKKREYFQDTDMIIIDEAHRIDDKRATMYQTFIQSIKDVYPSCRCVGLTATPFRTGLGLLTDGNLFTDICYDLCQLHQFNWLIQQGYLSRLIPKKTLIEYNVESIAITAGEYNLDQLQLVVDNFQLNKDILQEAVQWAQPMKKWLIFTTGIKHTEHIAQMLNQMGIITTYVHSKQTTEQRDEAIHWFKTGKCTAIVNNNILTTGFDAPDIDCIIVLRPTASPVLWVQMLGRGIRPFPGKSFCLVLDFAGNTRRLGPINDPVLPKTKKYGQKKNRLAPVVICPQCNSYVHAACTVCPYCNNVFPRDLKLAGQASDDALIAETELPRIETYDVDLVTYSEHNKTGKPLAIKVTYQCGYMFFNEYVCLEHGGFASKKARDWWRTASFDDYIPSTTQEALRYVYDLKTPQQISVWVNTKYPQVMAVYYKENNYTGESNEDIPF